MGKNLRASLEPTNPERILLRGTAYNFLAEALVLPTGLVTAAFLTRRLGPADYGLYTLAAVTIAWLEWTITAIFSRSAIKFVSEAEDWRPIGSAVFRWHLIVSLIAASGVFGGASILARLFNSEMLSGYLRIFALDIPLFGLARAHSTILMGLGSVNQRALACAARWITRLIFIILLVEAGFSVTGAIYGNIGASLIELSITRYYIRPSIFCKNGINMGQFWNYSFALFAFVLSLRIFERIDLFALKTLGGTASQAGIYAAVQNLTLAPSLFGLALSPILLAVLSRDLYLGDTEKAKQKGSGAMRIVLLLAPFAGMCAGASREIIMFLFGHSFQSAAPLLPPLMFGAVAMVMTSIAATILIAAGKPGWTFILTAPIVPFAVTGNMIVIPRMGPMGASLVTFFLSCLAAMATVLGVYKLWRILPPFGSFCRSTLVTAVTSVVAFFWAIEGIWLIVKLACITCLIPVLLMSLGEFKSHEIAMIRSSFAFRVNSQ